MMINLTFLGNGGSQDIAMFQVIEPLLPFFSHFTRKCLLLNMKNAVRCDMRLEIQRTWI